MTRRLIVNADDFGLSEAVNRGIIRAHRDGIVTSASLMACGSAFDHAVELARQNPRLGIGVHLTLTQERPLSDPVSVPTLATDGPRFPRSVFGLVRRYLAGRLDAEEIGRELEAQVQRVVRTGLRVTHFDGHQHIHVLPDVLALARALAERHGIRAARCPREALRWAAPVRMAQLVVLRQFCAACDWDGWTRTDAFAGFLDGGNQDVRAALDQLPATGTTELMCHPGEPDPASPYARWGYAWQAELDALTDPAIRPLLLAKGVELIDYGELSRSSERPIGE